VHQLTGIDPEQLLRREGFARYATLNPSLGHAADDPQLQPAEHSA
jgi:hypothetical protein